jgi:hypothetical protein
VPAGGGAWPPRVPASASPAPGPSGASGTDVAGPLSERRSCCRAVGVAAASVGISRAVAASLMTALSTSRAFAPAVCGRPRQRPGSAVSHCRPSHGRLRGPPWRRQQAAAARQRPRPAARSRTTLDTGGSSARMVAGVPSTPAFASIQSRSPWPGPSCLSRVATSTGTVEIHDSDCCSGTGSLFRLFP